MQRSVRYDERWDNAEKFKGIGYIVLEDYKGKKNIDAMNLYNNPSKAEVTELVINLFRLVYPGYYKDKNYKIYNPNNTLAVAVEDIFYHLNKQVTLALDFCRLKGEMTEEERKIESYHICKEFFYKIPKIRSIIETDLLAAYD